MFVGTGMRRFLSDISPQQVARLVLGGLIILGGLYVLSAFFAPLGWAVVLAIATWPLYQRFQAALPPKGRRDGAQNGGLGAQTRNAEHDSHGWAVDSWFEPD